ncbi:MAG TPA: hypothetical protein VIJ64_10615 [Candidatus Lustribacter sp.]
MKLIPISAAVLAAALTLVNAASAQVPTLPLPAPPSTGGSASSAIFDAMLAIARAAASNPRAAQTASFSYDAAIQQFNARDFTRSRMSALTAISQTAAVPLPQPSLYAPPIPQPSYYAMPNVVSPEHATAESYVALARRALLACGAPSQTPPAAITQQFDAAVRALTARDYAAAKTASYAVIDQCAAATRALAAAAAAASQPPATPIPMSSYSPQPVATLIPDPALQPGKT